MGVAAFEAALGTARTTPHTWHAIGGLALVPTSPDRLMDTRDGAGVHSEPLGRQGVVTLPVAGTKGVSADARA